MVDKKQQPLTRNIAKKGFCVMRSSSPASISMYLDSDVLRNPFQAVLPTELRNRKLKMEREAPASLIIFCQSYQYIYKSGGCTVSLRPTHIAKAKMAD